MKTITELWTMMNQIRLDERPLPDSLKREIQSFCLGGIEPIPVYESGGESDSASGPADSGFRFGPSSERELIGVDPRLVAVTRLALRYSKQDFCVYDGLRTHKEQALHVKNGTSNTMQSKHLLGLADDLVPWINGAPKWDWEGCYKIAYAMDRAATELGLAHLITWGGAWDRKLSDFGGNEQAYKDEVEKYRSRHPGKDFIDGPHFEILPN